MKKVTYILSICLISACSRGQDAQLDNTFYVFNNGVRDLLNTPKSIDSQAKFIKKIGYDGLSGHVSDDYYKRRSSLDKVGLKMPEIYWGMTLTKENGISYKEEIKEIIKDSKNRDLIVALFLNGEEYINDKDTGDLLMANGIRELADFAAAYNVRVAIYPHANNYSETAEHTLKLAKLVNRDNVGTIFNTCHLLKVEGEEGWEEKLLNMLPYLYMVSINGADSGNTKEMDWSRLIQPLGEGTFDTYKLVKLLKDNGYEGLFGLQCYNIKEDFEVALTKSLSTWKEYQKRYAKGD